MKSIRKPVGWLLGLVGVGLWWSAKFLGIGPLVGMGGTAQGFVIVAVLCWGGLLLADSGSTNEVPLEVETEDEDD